MSQSHIVATTILLNFLLIKLELIQWGNVLFLF